MLRRTLIVENSSDSMQLQLADLMLDTIYTILGTFVQAKFDNPASLMAAILLCPNLLHQKPLIGGGEELTPLLFGALFSVQVSEHVHVEQVEYPQALGPEKARHDGVVNQDA